MATKESQMKKSKVSNFWDGAKNIGSNLVKDAKAIGSATGRHIGGGIIEFIEDIMPGGQSIVESFPDIFADVKKAMGSTQSALEKEAKSILRLPTYRGILDWYTAKEDSMGGLMDDTDSELNFDVGEPSVTTGTEDKPDNSAADELTAEFKIADKVSNKISATVVETSKKNAELQVATLASITNALDKTNSIITAGFEKLNKTIQDLTTVVTNNTASIIKILEIGKQLDQENASRNSNNDILTFADLISGRFNIKKYAKTVGNKFNEKLGMVDYLFSDSTIDKRLQLLNMGLKLIPGFDFEITSPKEMVKWGIDKLTDAFLPDLRKGLASIDTGVTKWIQQTVLDLGQGFFMGQKVQGDFWTGILDLFGISKESGRLKKIEKNDFEHKQISFDTETKESIVKVIPAYLEKITNALTGAEYHYDLKQRKLRKKSEIQASYLQERKEKLEYNINFSEFNEILNESLAGTKYAGEKIDLEDSTKGEINILFLKMIKRLYAEIITGYGSTEEILNSFGKTEKEISDNIAYKYLGLKNGMDDLNSDQKEAVIKLAHMIAAIIQQPEQIKNLTKNAFNYQRDINELQAETNKFYENQNAIDLFANVDNPEKEEEFFEIANKKLNKLLYRKKKFDTVLAILKTLNENPTKVLGKATVGRLKDNLKNLWNNDFKDDQNLQKIFEELQESVNLIGAEDIIKNDFTGEEFKQSDFQKLLTNLGSSKNLTSKTLSELMNVDKDSDNQRKLLDALESYIIKLEENIETEKDQSIQNYSDKMNENARKGLLDLAEKTGSSTEKNVQFEVTFPEQFKTGFDRLADQFKSILGPGSGSFTEIFNTKADEGLKHLANIYKLINEKQFNVIVQRINKQANEPKSEPKIESSNLIETSSSSNKLENQLSLPIDPVIKSEEISENNRPIQTQYELINSEKEVLTDEGLKIATSNDEFSNNNKQKIRNTIEKFLRTGEISNEDTGLINIKEFTPERVNALAAKYNIDKTNIPHSIIQTVHASDTNLITKPVSTANSSKVEQSKGAQSIQDGVKKLISTATGGGGGSQAASEAVNQIVKGSIDMVAEPVIKPMQESLKPIGQHINTTIFGGTFEEKVVDSKGNVKTVVKKVPEGGLLGFAQEKVGNFFKNLIPSEDKINKVNKDVAKQAKRFASNFKSKDKNGKPIPGTFDWEGLVGRIVGGLGGGALAGPIGSIIGVMVGNLLPIAPIGNAIKNFVVGDLFDKHADPKNPKMGFFEKVFFNWFIPFKTEFGKTMKFLFANVKRNIIGPFLTFGAGIGALFKNGFKGIGQMPWFRSLSNWWKNTPIGKGFKLLGDKVSGFFRMVFGGIGRLITGGLARLFGGLTRGAIGAGTGVVGVGGGIINSILGAIGGKEVREAMKHQNQLNTAAYNKDLSKNGLLSISGAIGELLRGNTGYVKRMFTDKDSVDWWWSNASEIKREREGWLNTRATIRDFFTGGNEAAEVPPPRTEAEKAQVKTAQLLEAIAKHQGVKVDSKSEKISNDEKAKQEAQIKEQKEKKQAGDAVVSATIGHLSDNLMDAVRNGDMTLQEAESRMNKALQHVPESLKGAFKTVRRMARSVSVGIDNTKKKVSNWWEKIKDLIFPIFSAIGNLLSPLLSPWLLKIGAIAGGIALLSSAISDNGIIGKTCRGILDFIAPHQTANERRDKANDIITKKTIQTAVHAAINEQAKNVGEKVAKYVESEEFKNAQEKYTQKQQNARKLTDKNIKTQEEIDKVNQEKINAENEQLRVGKQIKDLENKIKAEENKLKRTKNPAKRSKIQNDIKTYKNALSTAQKSFEELSKIKGSAKASIVKLNAKVNAPSFAQGVTRGMARSFIASGRLFQSVAGGRYYMLNCAALFATQVTNWLLDTILPTILDHSQMSAEEKEQWKNTIVLFADLGILLFSAKMLNRISTGLRRTFSNIAAKSEQRFFKGINELLQKAGKPLIKSKPGIISKFFDTIFDFLFNKLPAKLCALPNAVIEKICRSALVKAEQTVTKETAKATAEGATEGAALVVIAAASFVYNTTAGWEETFEIPYESFKDLKNIDTSITEWFMRAIAGMLGSIFDSLPLLGFLELFGTIFLLAASNISDGLMGLFKAFGFILPDHLESFRALIAWFLLNIPFLFNKNSLKASKTAIDNKYKFYEAKAEKEGLSEAEKHSASLANELTSAFSGNAGKGRRNWGLVGRWERKNIQSQDKKITLFRKGTDYSKIYNSDGSINKEELNKAAAHATNEKGERIEWVGHLNWAPERFWKDNFGVDLLNPENAKNKYDKNGNLIGKEITDDLAIYGFNPFISKKSGKLNEKFPWFVDYIDAMDSYLFYRTLELAKKFPRFYGFLNPEVQFENGMNFVSGQIDGNTKKFFYKPDKYPPGVDSTKPYTLLDPTKSIKNILINYYKKYPNSIREHSITQIIELALREHLKNNRTFYYKNYHANPDEDQLLYKYLYNIGNPEKANDPDFEKEIKINNLYNKTKANLSEKIHIGMGEGYDEYKLFGSSSLLQKATEESNKINKNEINNKNEIQRFYKYGHPANVPLDQRAKYQSAYNLYKYNYYNNRTDNKDFSQYLMYDNTLDPLVLVRSNRETQASNAQASAKVATQSSKSNNKDAVKAKIATKAEAGKDSTVNSSKVAEAEKTMEAVANPAPEGSLVYPVTNYKSFPITSPFGPRWGKFHKGIDLGIPERTPLLAMADGIVTGVGYEAGGYGHWITYKIPSNGLNVIYGHLCEQPKVSKGTAIKKGQIIALSGNTGHSTGPHLHLEIRKGQPGSTDDWNSSQPMNPEQVLEGLTSVAGFNGENSGTAGTANGSSSKTGGILGWLQNSSPYGSLLKFLGSIFTGSQESSSSENTTGGVSSAGAANMSMAASDANREKIYKMLRNKGYSPEAAIGILANIEAESSYRTNVESYDGEGSIGICQWTYGRRTNLENFARKKGKPVSDLETQVEYLITELEGPYKGVNALKNTNDYGLMAEKFCRDFEVPADVEIRVGERRNMASKLAPILMKLENEPTGSTQISMTNIATQYGMAGGLGDSLADLNPFKSIQNSFNNLDTSSITSKITPQLPGLTNVNPDQPLSTTVSQTKAVTKDKNIEEKMDIMIAIFTQILQLIKQGNNINSTGNGFLESMMNMSNAEKQKVLDKIREKQRNSSNHYSPNIYPSAIVGFVKGY